MKHSLFQKYLVSYEKRKGPFHKSNKINEPQKLYMIYCISLNRSNDCYTQNMKLLPSLVYFHSG